MAINVFIIILKKKHLNNGPIVGATKTAESCFLRFTKSFVQSHNENKWSKTYFRNVYILYSVSHTANWALSLEHRSRCQNINWRSTITYTLLWTQITKLCTHTVHRSPFTVHCSLSKLMFLEIWRVNFKKQILSTKHWTDFNLLFTSMYGKALKSLKRWWIHWIHSTIVKHS